MKLNPLLKGTIMLTVAGFITRFLGFFYRIFLSNSIGAEKLGLYQLIFPVYGICHTIYAAGIQTALSKHIAEAIAAGNPCNARKLLKKCLLLSVLIACFLSLLIYFNAAFIASNILIEPAAADSLRVLAFCFPFCGITSCINGYYYGRKQAFVPASTQLLEQLIRILFVYLVTILLSGNTSVLSCELAVMGIVVGEMLSAIYNLISLYHPKEKQNTAKSSNSISIINPLIKTALPLTLNRLLINILHSFEAVLIPVLLKRFGLNNAEALSLFGIVTGMAVPFLAFPSTLTNSLSVLLLPEISEAAYTNKTKKLSRTIHLSVKYSLQLGIISAALFAFFGSCLGENIFHELRAGEYLTILSLICPLMYLTTTLGSILNGLGKQNATFMNSIVGSALKLVMLTVLIPVYGIYGYFAALYIGQTVIMILDLRLLYKSGYRLSGITEMITKPIIISFISGIIIFKIYEYTASVISASRILLLLVFCLIYMLIYLALLKITNCLQRLNPL